MKNFLAAGLAVLAIGFCCFGHIFLASLGGAGLIMGLFTNKILLVTIALIVLTALFEIVTLSLIWNGE